MSYFCSGLSFQNTISLQGCFTKPMDLGLNLGINQYFAKFKCWVCEEADDETSQQELKVSPSKPVRQRLASPFSSDVPIEGMATDSMDERYSPDRPPSHVSLQTPLTSPREHERQQLREMMKVFARRGMQGVPIHLADEFSGALVPASYHIDERLQSISFSAEESQTLRFSGSPSHSSKIEQIVEIVQAEEASPHLELGAWDQLSDMERRRLLVLTYSIEPPGSIEPLEHRKVCFLEASEDASKNFVICIRILRRYFHDLRVSQPRAI